MVYNRWRWWQRWWWYFRSKDWERQHRWRRTQKSKLCTGYNIMIPAIGILYIDILLTPMCCVVSEPTRCRCECPGQLLAHAVQSAATAVTSNTQWGCGHECRQVGGLGGLHWRLNHQKYYFTITRMQFHYNEEPCNHMFKIQLVLCYINMMIILVKAAVSEPCLNFDVKLLVHRNLFHGDHVLTPSPLPVPRLGLTEDSRSTDFCLYSF